MSKKEFKQKLKKSIIALSQVNDMPIPQRILQIKDILINEMWDDEKFCKKIEDEYKKIESNDHYFHLSEYKDLKKIKNGKIDTRTFHYFNDVHVQIALAVYFHDKEKLNEIHKFYSKENELIRKKLNIWKDDKDKSKQRKLNRTNFGNISYIFESDYKCNNDELFRPFYFDWKIKWNQFLKRLANFSNIESDNILILKIDFKNSYGNLDINFLKNKTPMRKLYNVASKYRCNNKKILGVPYGGPVESHMIANFLILKKLQLVAEKIILKGHEVLDLVSYADDSCIVIRYKNNNKSNDLENACKDIETLILSEELAKLKIHPVEKNNQRKTYIFKIRSKRDFKKVRDSYTSLSSINSLFLASKLSEKKFSIEKTFQSVGSNTKTFERISRKENIEKIYDAINISEFSEKNESKLFALFDYNNGPKNINFYISHSIIKFNKEHHVHYLLNILKKNFNEYCKNNSEDLIYFFTELLKVINNLIQNQEWESVKNILLFIENEHLKEKINWGKPTAKLVAISIKTVSEKYKYLKKSISNKSFVNDEKIIKFIYKARSWIGYGHQFLYKHISYISKIKYEECEFTNININNKYIFNEEIEVSGHREYWNYTKKALSFIFSKLFEEEETLLFWRFHRLLNNSSNRIEYIENIRFLNDNINEISDINEMVISNYDKKIFRLICLTPENLAEDSNWLYKTDKLCQIRQLVQLLWTNGSIATQFYTVHNHLHGDALLLKYHEFKSIEKIRNFIKKDDISIFPLIASLYIHDLGMLWAGDINIEEMEKDNKKELKTFKDILEKSSFLSRKNHGEKSANILNNWISKFIQIDEKWIEPIAIASKFHSDESEYENLKESENYKNVNNALILSILDLLDITFKRSSLLSRKLTGTLAPKESIKHWLKHYVTKNISIKMMKNKEITIEIYLNKKIMDSHLKHIEDIKNFIKKEIEKYMNSLINSLIKNIYKEERFEISQNIVFKEEEEWPENHKLKFFDSNIKPWEFYHEMKDEN